MANSIYDLQNKAINKSKNMANQQMFNQEAQNSIGANYQQELDAYNSRLNNPNNSGMLGESLYNTQLKSLTDEYSNLNDELNGLFKNKYGADYDISQGMDRSDPSAYSEYLRLTSLMRENENARNALESNELSRQSQLSSQNNIRMQQQKYMDEYAKMNGMGYGGYSAGLQSQAYNDYAREVANINANVDESNKAAIQAYRDNATTINDAATTYKDAAMQEDFSTYSTLLNNVTDLSSLDELNSRYKDVIDYYKKNDRNFEYDLNQMGADYLLTQAFTLRDTGNPDVRIYDPTLSIDDFDKLVKEHPDYWNSMDKDTRDYLKGRYTSQLLGDIVSYDPNKQTFKPKVSKETYEELKEKYSSYLSEDVKKELDNLYEKKSNKSNKNVNNKTLLELMREGATDYHSRTA